MDRSPGLSSEEREELLHRIDELLGASPKGKLLREIVEALPTADSEETARRSGLGEIDCPAEQEPPDCHDAAGSAGEVNRDHRQVHARGIGSRPQPQPARSD